MDFQQNVRREDEKRWTIFFPVPVDEVEDEVEDDEVVSWIDRRRHHREIRREEEKKKKKMMIEMKRDDDITVEETAGSPLCLLSVLLLLLLLSDFALAAGFSLASSLQLDFLSSLRLLLLFSSMFTVDCLLS
ncbi:hypothetical protein TRV_07358 [Trichophyton verrucosum HKI 0517]|uniref:Transmembrane protein n=1 Tax=Trichophyton verrucosum (strain HKI 0517) TaxID=663202 RepID=D4DJJ0_TRIVH|nr:uncharacterized protein TRV_07358 [Trichophyton verrucosum HKI 0517]EFE38023.1 hypothetical protein TRV_07358 [Trichophyton verrucosum HKI 0517]